MLLLIITCRYCRYYSEGLQAVEHFGNYINELTGKLDDIRHVQESEKAELVEVRNSLKTSHGLEKLVRILCVDAYIDSNAVLLHTPFRLAYFCISLIIYFRLMRSIAMKHIWDLHLILF